MTFEPRHENKSCSACPEDQLKLFKISNFQIFKKFQIFKFSKNFKISNFLWFPAFVWLSDIFYNKHQTKTYHCREVLGHSINGIFTWKIICWLFIVTQVVTSLLKWQNQNVPDIILVKRPDVARALLQYQKETAKRGQNTSIAHGPLFQSYKKNLYLNT